MNTSDGPLISVIVPIYNVEKYVRKCLDSLKNQTMKEIEIICIDDGSTDGSGEIAEKYKNEVGWPRFRVIHTENRGLSAARNRGIDEAIAEWIMFVDSDDWVDSRFCEKPYGAAVEHGVDLVIFGFWHVKKTRKKKSKELPVGVVDEMTAHEYGSTAAWNKLYKNELFERIRYPEGRVYEDFATTHKLVHKAKRVFLIRDYLYYHVMWREDSITNTHTITNHKASFTAYIERYKDLLSYGYPVAKISACGPAIGFLSVSTPSNDQLYLKAVDIVTSAKGIPKELTLKQKIGLIVWKISKPMFYTICRRIGRA